MFRIIINAINHIKIVLAASLKMNNQDIPRIKVIAPI